MTITARIDPGGKPKREILEMAFDDCGLAGYEFDRTPEEQSMALRKLNALMLELPWSALGYDQPSYGVGQAEGGSGIPDFAVNAVSQYLALRIAPGIGLTLSPEYSKTAARSLVTLQAALATTPTMTLPGNTVRGSGQRPYSGAARYPYTGRT